MKNSRSLIVTLVALCMLFALVSFFMPTHGLAFSYLTISLAVIIGVLCLGNLLRLFFRGK